jgi:hypothetical protein
MPTTTNNLYYPKGYALTVGINDFTKWNSSGDIDLKECLNDVDYWKGELKYRGYDFIYKLKDSEATLDRIICGIWCMAQHAIAGDVVFISFSTHGECKKGYNYLYTYNKGEIFSENILRFLLKAFKPFVRVFVVTDACQSGSFLSPYESNNRIIPVEINLIEKAVQNLLPSHLTNVKKLLAAQATTLISASVVHLAVINDELDIPDGNLTKKLKDAFYWSYSFNAEQLRDRIDQYYDADFYQDKLNFIPYISDNYHKDPTLKKYLDDKAKFNDQTVSEFLKSLTKSNIIFDDLHQRIERNIGDFNKDTELEKTFKKVFGNWKTRKDLAWFYNPVINFLGQNSKAFGEQYIFKKYDSSYYYENKNKV